MSAQQPQKPQFPENPLKQPLYKNRIDIKPLKALVLERFPENCPLRIALLAERDLLEVYEFLAKMETWMNLLKMI